MIIEKHEHPSKAKTPLENWADRAVKHLGHHFKCSQTIVNEYTKFIFHSKGFKPQDVLDALGPHAKQMLELLQEQAKMIDALLGTQTRVIPQDLTLFINHDAGTGLTRIQVVDPPSMDSAVSDVKPVLPDEAIASSPAAAIAAAATNANENPASAQPIGL